ncbi:MAG: response regulator, partial [Rhodocyclaceae bacterium]|nr:response regulator [Rhodocyclaceae bacterium]
MTNRIMIVEDERIVALDLRQTLESFGHEVITVVSSGEQAIAQAQALHPDLILMDINLDGTMDGTAAAQAIHDSERIPVVFLTAYAEQEILDRAEASCPYGYLVKPVETRALQAAVRMAVARRHAELEVEKTEERLRLAVDAAQLGVWEWDAASARFVGQGRLESILGQMPGTLEGRDGAFLDRIEPADRTSISSALTAGGVISATVKLLESPGTGRNGWVDFHARAFRAPQGGLQRAVGVIRDVTVQHELEEELRRASVVFRSSG